LIDLWKKKNEKENQKVGHIKKMSRKNREMGKEMAYISNSI